MLGVIGGSDHLVEGGRGDVLTGQWLQGHTEGRGAPVCESVWTGPAAWPRCGVREAAYGGRVSCLSLCHRLITPLQIAPY